MYSVAIEIVWIFSASMYISDTFLRVYFYPWVSTTATTSSQYSASKKHHGQHSNQSIILLSVVGTVYSMANTIHTHSSYWYG